MLRSLLPGVLGACLTLSLGSALSAQSPVEARTIENSVASSVGRMGTLTDSQDASADDSRIEAELREAIPDFVVISKGGSSSGDRDSALRRLPLRQLNTTQRQAVQQITSQCAQYRHLPLIGFEGEPRAYQFFLQNPDAAVSVWRALGISRMKVSRESDHVYRTDGGEGTAGTIEYLYRGTNSSLVICDGSFQSPFLPSPIKARALFHLVSETRLDPKGGVPTLRHTADVFVSFPSAAIEAAARVIAPVSNSIADRNFREVSLFLRTMSTAMSEHPGWVEQISNSMDGVPPATIEEMMNLAVDLHVEHKRREDRRISQLTLANGPHEEPAPKARREATIATPVSSTDVAVTGRGFNREEMNSTAVLELINLQQASSQSLSKEARAAEAAESTAPMSPAKDNVASSNAAPALPVAPPPGK